MKFILSAFAFLHGTIHLLGFIKAFGLGRMEQLNASISKFAGIMWLVAFVLFLTSSIAFLSDAKWKYILVFMAIVISAILIISVWQDAKYGMILNVLILFLSILLMFGGFKSVEPVYTASVKSEFVNQPLTPEELLSEEDIAGLPSPVQKYIRYAGAIGKSKPQNVRIEFEAGMVKKPGDSPMNAHSEQYNFFGNYARFFLMKASKLGIPFIAYHAYCDQKATFIVRIASLYNAVDIKGEVLTAAETVTLLNDMCVFAPGSLIDKRLSWKEIKPLSTQVTLINGAYRATAILHFNEKGELVNFVSDDRYALQDDGTMKKARWSTPVGDYREFSGRKIPTYGETIWNYPEGDFKYGTFRLKDIKYNVN